MMSELDWTEDFENVYWVDWTVRSLSRTFDRQLFMGSGIWSIELMDGLKRRVRYLIRNYGKLEESFRRAVVSDVVCAFTGLEVVEFDCIGVVGEEVGTVRLLDNAFSYLSGYQQNGGQGDFSIGEHLDGSRELEFYAQKIVNKLGYSVCWSGSAVVLGWEFLPYYYYSYYKR